VGTPAQFSQDEDVPLQHGIGTTPLRKALLADPDVRQVLPRVAFSGLISNGDKSARDAGHGHRPRPRVCRQGPLPCRCVPARCWHRRQEAEVMLGEGLARSLKATPGSSLTLLASTTEGALNALDVTSRACSAAACPTSTSAGLHRLATAQRCWHAARVQPGRVPDRMDRTAPAQAARGGGPTGLQVQTWQDQAFYYAACAVLYNRIFGALGLIIAVIVVFVVTNAMAMAIIERTREIGTLRALGTCHAS
jgi:putative ABC transport system permease protein